ncbi:hypothetical protein C8J57DRAFT_1326230, partial [Mycena rebaudengoi]
MLNRHGIDTSHTSRPPTEQFVLHSYFVVHPRLLPLRHLLSHSSLYFLPLLTPSPPPLPIPDPRPFHPRPPYSTCRRPHESLPSSTPFPFFRLVSSRDLEIRRSPAPGTRGEGSDWRSGIAAGVAPPCRVASPSRVAMSFIIIVFCRVCGHGQYRDA